MTCDLPNISVVIVTFERFSTLDITLRSFLEKTDYPRGRMEIIVADDGSEPCTLDKIRNLPVNHVVSGAVRTGLGANVNRGLAVASHDLVLQIQDDWECLGPSDYLVRAVRLLQWRSDIGMVLLNSHPHPQLGGDLLPFGNSTVKIHQNRPGRRVRLVGEHAYTDWPHLKTRAFREKIGLYQEGVPMWKMELDYSRRVNAQVELHIAEFVKQSAFTHIGAELSYNNGSLRSCVMAKIRSIPGFAIMLDCLKKHTRSCE
ncbi:MAG: glycosyltransferase [Polynucleobacter sp.]|nr:glycosyltransferase [Polynucleobacter sp.]